MTNKTDVYSVDHSKQRGLFGYSRCITCPNRNNTIGVHNKMHDVIDPIPTAAGNGV